MPFPFTSIRRRCRSTVVLMLTLAATWAEPAARGMDGRQGPPLALVGDELAVPCADGTERPRLAPEDVVVTTVLEHHANLLPWARVPAAPSWLPG